MEPVVIFIREPIVWGVPSPYRLRVHCVFQRNYAGSALFFRLPSNLWSWKLRRKSRVDFSRYIFVSLIVFTPHSKTIIANSVPHRHRSSLGLHTCVSFCLSSLNRHSLMVYPTCSCALLFFHLTQGRRKVMAPGGAKGAQYYYSE